MPSQSLLQLRAVILHPPPDRCVIDFEISLLQQLLNISQRERIAKIPPDRTKDDAGFGLPPFEDRGSGSHFAILSRHHSATLKVATHQVDRVVAGKLLCVSDLVNFRPGTSAERTFPATLVQFSTASSKGLEF